MKRFLTFLILLAVISSAALIWGAPMSAAPTPRNDTDLEKRELPAIQQAIEEKGARWIARKTSASKLSLEERGRRCGTLPERGAGERAIAGERLVALPPAFDWRDYGGCNWMTSVKNQGNCGSCWAFGSLAALEACLRLLRGDCSLPCNLSEQFLLSCSAGSCNGWYISSTLNYLQNTGTVDEACFPYRADDTIPCSDRCPDWQSRITKVATWGWVGGGWGPISANTIKQRLLEGPLPSYMDVYSDFFYYEEGVYEYVWGNLAGGHLVTLVGWDDSQGCWICKNSWGTGWGEGGYFRIKMGENEVAIEEGTAYLTAASSTPPPVTPKLSSPPDRSTVSDLNPKLEWQASAGATSYGLQVATDSYFHNLVIDQAEITNAYYDVPEGKLDWERRYYWHVNASNENGTSKWSARWYFRTPKGPQPPLAPKLSSPPNRSTVSDLNPKLEWQTSAGATSYGLQVATDSYFRNLVIDQAEITNAYYDVPEGKLDWERRYYWHVNASNENGTSKWSARWYFRTPKAP